MNKQRTGTIFPQVFPKKLNYFENKEKFIESLMYDTPLTHLARGIKELIATVVSKANKCMYSFNHYFNSMQDYGIDYDIASEIKVDYRSSSLEKKIIALLEFCEDLVLSTDCKSDLDKRLKDLRSLGWTEEELHEAIIICHEITSINKIIKDLDLKDGLPELNHTRTPIQREHL